MYKIMTHDVINRTIVLIIRHEIYMVFDIMYTSHDSVEQSPVSLTCSCVNVIFTIEIKCMHSQNIVT